MERFATTRVMIRNNSRFLPLPQVVPFRRCVKSWKARHGQDSQQKRMKSKLDFGYSEIDVEVNWLHRGWLKNKNKNQDAGSLDVGCFLDSASCCGQVSRINNKLEPRSKEIQRQFILSSGRHKRDFFVYHSTPPNVKEQKRRRITPCHAMLPPLLHHYILNSRSTSNLKSK